MKNVKFFLTVLAVFLLCASVAFVSCTGTGDGTTAATDNITSSPVDDTKGENTSGETDQTTGESDDTASEETTSEETTSEETAPVHTHTYGDWNTVKAATCTEDGSRERACSCGEKETEVVKATGHTWGEWGTLKAPTCTEAGVSERQCACGEKETQAIPAEGHSSGDWIIDKEPTCTAPGSKHGSCTKCGESAAVEEIPATGHKEVTDPAVEPTCTKEGLTEGSHCEICNEVITAQQSVAVISHIPGEWVVSKEPSCTEKGSRDGLCARCGEKYTSEEIPAKGHTEISVPGKDSTCTAEGLSAGVKCSVCNEVIKAQTSVPKADHTPGEWIIDKEATATATGSKHQPCAICGTTLATEVIPANPHVPGEWIIDKEATCTVEGTRHRICTKCGETINTEVIPVKPHTEKVIPAKEATCTEKGLTAGKTCTVCQNTLIAQTEVPAKGHSEVADYSKNPTCTETGLTAGAHCSVCGTVIKAQETIPATGHSEIIDAAKEATCTETGLTAGKHCGVCGHVITAQTVVPAKGHKETILAAKEPTCVLSGLTEGTKCSVCNEILKTQTTIPATGHKSVTDPAKAPTCTETGLSEGAHCSVCNTTITAQLIVPAAGHKDGQWIVDKEPTYTETGSQHKECTVCGVTTKTETLPVKERPKIDYTVFVVDGFGNPISGIKVNVKSGASVAGTAVTDALGVAVFKLVAGNYDVSAELGTDYESATSGKLTETSFETMISMLGMIKDPMMIYPDETNGVFNLSDGSAYVPLVQNGVRYFLFHVPDGGGVYNFYTDSAKIEIGYYGGSHYVFPEPAKKSDANGVLEFTFRATEGGNIVVIGLKASDTSDKCLLTVKKVSDVEITPEERDYEPYQLKNPPTKVTETPAGTLSNINITVSLPSMAGSAPIKVVYNENDGFYHLDTADGPVIYVRITSASPYLDELTAMVSSIGRYFYAEDGTFIKKEGYNDAIKAYSSYVNDDGVVPLDDDLIYILQNMGVGGWYDINSQNWLFESALIASANCWLFACCVYK